MTHAFSPRRTAGAVLALLASTACLPQGGPAVPPTPGSVSDAMATPPDVASSPRASWSDAEEPAVGEIRLFVGNYAPRNWGFCQGGMTSAEAYPDLYALLGDTYGSERKLEGWQPSKPDSGKSVTYFGLPTLESPLADKAGGRYIIAARGKKPVFGTGNGDGLERGMVGEIRLWSTDQVPQGWLPCDGATLPASTYQDLYSIIGTIYGGDDQGHFKLPNLPAMGEIRYLICTAGALPVAAPQEATSRLKKGPGEVPATYTMLGTIGMFAGDFTPSGWRVCDGTTAPIIDNAPLYALMGNTFGGDSRQTFALPKLTMPAEPKVRYIVNLDGTFPAY